MPQDTDIKKLTHEYIPNAAGNFYTAASGKTTLIRNMAIHNADSSDRQVELWIVPNGGSRTNENKIFKRSIIAGETYFIEFSYILTSLDEIHGLAAAANVVNICINGAELSAVT